MSTYLQHDNLPVIISLVSHLVNRGCCDHYLYSSHQIPRGLIGIDNWSTTTSSVVFELIIGNGLLLGRS